MIWSYISTVAAITLVPVMALVIYTLNIQINKDGWTLMNLWTTIGFLIMIGYSLGYAAAALKRGPWMQWIERWNFMMALFIVTLLTALLTPLVNPARLSVIDQMARLQSGEILPQKFNFSNLASSKRFGYEALLKLQKTSDGPEAAYIRGRASKTLSQKIRSTMPPIPKRESKLTTQQKQRQIALHTPKEQLPTSFLAQDWRTTYRAPDCLKLKEQHCDAWLQDLNHNGVKEILLFDGEKLTGFFQNDQPKWELIGTWQPQNSCKALFKALQAGEFKPILPAWPDIQVKGTRIRLNE